MTPPVSIVVAGHTFAIEVVEDPDDALSRHANSDAIGSMNVERGRIRVRGGLEESEHNLRETMLHEVIHACLSLTSHETHEGDVYKSKRSGERVVELMAIHLLDTLRRNPELVRYLMDGAW